jgi:hypothetical protein
MLPRPGAMLPRPGAMLPRPGALVAAVLVAGVLLPAGCTAGSPPQPGSAAQTPLPPAPQDARAQLAGWAAAAKDRRYVARYTLTQGSRPARTVLVTLAVDGSWRVDVPGAGLGGSVDVSVAATREGLYQCVLATNAATVSTCVRVAGHGGALPAAADPRVEHAFTDWLDVLTDRDVAISVTAAQTLPGARGACFSVEPTAVSLVSAIDAGIYCYDSDGTLTGVRCAFGTLLLATAAGPAPASVTLPGPVAPGTPLPTAAPPAPSGSRSASPGRR